MFWCEEKTPFQCPQTFQEDGRGFLKILKYYSVSYRVQVLFLDVSQSKRPPSPKPSSHQQLLVTSNINNVKIIHIIVMELKGVRHVPF